MLFRLGQFRAKQASALRGREINCPALLKQIAGCLLLVLGSGPAHAEVLFGFSVNPPARREVITGSLTYTVQVTNRTETRVHNVRVTVKLPPSLP